jgi:hypothetical protein
MWRQQIIVTSQGRLEYIVDFNNLITMKNVFIIILLLLTFVGSVPTYSQTNVQEAHYKNGDIALRKFFLEKLDDARKKNNLDVCLISVTFAKFCIDSVGNITGLSFCETKDTPPVFRKILTTIIYSTNGSWIPKTVDGRATESKPFILPLIYQMEAGCSANHIHVNNGTDTSIIGLFDFDDKTKMLTQLDCILLKPIAVFSQN